MSTSLLLLTDNQMSPGQDVSSAHQDLKSVSLFSEAIFLAASTPPSLNYTSKYMDALKNKRYRHFRYSIIYT